MSDDLNKVFRALIHDARVYYQVGDPCEASFYLGMALISCKVAEELAVDASPRSGVGEGRL